MSFLGAVAATLQNVVKWRLKSIFSSASDQSFINNQVVDTESEGMKVGSFTITDLDDGTVGISNGRLQLRGNTTNPDVCLNFGWFRRQAGRAVIFTVERDGNFNGNPQFGIAYEDPGIQGATAKTSYMFQGDYGHNGLTFQERVTGTTTRQNNYDWPLNTPDKWCLILGGYDDDSWRTAYANGEAKDQYSGGCALIHYDSTLGKWVLEQWSYYQYTGYDYWLLMTSLSEDALLHFENVDIPDWDGMEMLKPLVSDQFIDNDNVLITAHSTAEDYSWTEHEYYNSGSATGNGEIIGNSATGTITSGTIGNIYYKTGVSTGCMVDIVTTKINSDAQDNLFLLFRVKDQFNYLALGTDATSTTLTIYSVVAGVKSVIASGDTFPASEKHRLRIFDYGDTIKVWKDYVLSFTTSSTTHAGETGVGFGVLASDAYTSQTVDYFRATPTGINNEFAGISSGYYKKLPVPPRYADLFAWYDAQEAASLYQDELRRTVADTSGQSVAFWRDQGPYGYHFSNPTSGERPTVSVDSGSGNFMVSADGTQWLENTQDVWQGLHDGGPSTIFIVCKTGANFDSRYALFGTCGDSIDNKGYSVFLDDRSSVLVNDSASLLVGKGTTGTAAFYGVAPDDSVVSGTLNILVVSYDGGATGDDCQMYNEDTQIYSADSTSANSTGTPTYDAQLFASGNDLAPMIGEIGEIIMYSRILSASERQDIVSYLKDKWGLV